VLSAAVMLVWFIFFPPPEPPAQTAVTGQTGTEAVVTAPAETSPTQPQTEADPVPEAPRLAIDTPKLSGSLSLRGGRIDDLSLKTYRESLDAGAPIVRLLSPVGEELSYYSVFGWLPGTGLDVTDVPDANTAWTTTAGATLTPDQPVTLRWENSKGLTFLREIS
ncbi:MAG: membrane protein insertase YidC, partial [Pseudomonadota bacterium]